MTDDTRRSLPLRWARVSFVLAGLAAVAAAAGLVMSSSDASTGTESVSTFVRPPTAPTEPVTPMNPAATTDLPSPSSAPAPSDTSTGTPADTTLAATGTSGDLAATPPATSVPDQPLSPLAAQLGERGSAIPETIEPRVVPTALAIDDIGVFHPVRAIGLEADGELEIPDETEIGWYRYGAVPGRPGATVLAAHVTWNRTTGPFFLLRDLEPGARIDVVLADGSIATYEAVERTVYDKDELPRDRIWRNTGDEMLVLITCGGDYNPDIRRYRQNVVVYAVPVDDGTDGGEG